jgi:hypothetical protein
VLGLELVVTEGRVVLREDGSGRLAGHFVRGVEKQDAPPVRFREFL